MINLSQKLTCFQPKPTEIGAGALTLPQRGQKVISLCKVLVHAFVSWKRHQILEGKPGGCSLLNNPRRTRAEPEGWAPWWLRTRQNKRCFMGLHRFKIAPMWFPGKNLAGHREVWGIQRELMELLGEINVSDVLTAAPHDWRHRGPRSRIIQRAGQNPGYFSCRTKPRLFLRCFM